MSSATANGTTNGTNECSKCDSVSAWLGGLKTPRTPVAHPVLPKAGKKNILITSALPYVNNVPHLGNIIGCVLSGDCYARYCRLRGYQTLYICGTDEYGTATETKALEEGLTCQQVCDKYFALHAQVYEWFNINFDYFGRTTTQHQTDIAQDIFHKLYQNGHLIEQKVDQLLCVDCNRYLADRFVEGVCPLCGYGDARGDQCDKCGKLINAVELIKPTCKVCSGTPVVRTSTHLYINLPELETRLQKFIDESQCTGVWSANAVHITKSWIKEGLKPRAITRDLKWGTPVPLDGYRDKVFYVWFDAPIGYISITANYTSEWERWWKNPKEVKLVNFMAKDNVPFHTVIFPASLIGTDDNYTLLNDISSTEYLNYENDKFSKSRNQGVFGNNAIDSDIKADVFRLYLLSNRPENHDTSFIWDDLISRNNNEFINNLGNFVNRTLSMLFKTQGGVVRKVELNEAETTLIKSVNIELAAFIDAFEHYKIREAFAALLAISTLGNQYFQASKPWHLPVDSPYLASVLSFSANLVALLALLLEPFAPATSAQILSDLKLPFEKYSISDHFVRLLEEGTVISEPRIYFSKIDPARGAELRAKYGGQKSNPEKVLEEEQFEKFKTEVSSKNKNELDLLSSLQVDRIKDLKIKGGAEILIKSELQKLDYLKGLLGKLSA